MVNENWIINWARKEQWSMGLTKRIKFVHLALSLFVVTSSVAVFPVFAEQSQRARFSSQDKPSTRSHAVITYTPLELPGGSRLTVISPQDWEATGHKLGAVLSSTHERFYRLLGSIPKITTTVRLMDAELFYEKTGAPTWTNAMYYRGEVMIPISSQSPMDYEELTRAVKHEYTHAILHALSNGRCPGWLDEGIAQWAEGDENPALQPALHRWLKSNQPIPLAKLGGGFTRLDTSMVPAAYAQSLFASNMILSSHGFKSLSRYFRELKINSETSEPILFKRAFGIKPSIFESQLATLLQKWRHKRSSYEQKILTERHSK
jgi:hypothetical protein